MNKFREYLIALFVRHFNAVCRWSYLHGFFVAITQSLLNLGFCSFLKISNSILFLRHHLLDILDNRPARVPEAVIQNPFYLQTPISSKDDRSEREKLLPHELEWYLLNDMFTFVSHSWWSLYCVDPLSLLYSATSSFATILRLDLDILLVNVNRPRQERMANPMLI